jgi:hypothetical protein
VLEEGDDRVADHRDRCAQEQDGGRHI